MIGGGAIARRYAKALFDLAPDTAGAEQLLAEVQSLTETAQTNEETERVLFTPIYPRAKRRAVIEDLARALGLSDSARIFALLLVEENRTDSLPGICDALRGFVDEAAGRRKAEITSARPLEPSQLEALKSALSARVGSQVEIETKVDPSLIGGVVARLGDLLLDGSVRTQLASLRGSLRQA